MFNSLFINPLVVMPIAGMALNYYQISIPFALTAIIKNIGSGASSMALFTFGLSLSHIKLNKQALSKEILFLVLVKNIAHPLIAFMLGKYMFHLQSYWLTSLVMVTSAPTAFIIYLIARQFDIDKELVKVTITVTIYHFPNLYNYNFFIKMKTIL